jgi:hypothetical protein
MAQSDLFSGSHLPIRWRQWRQLDPGRRAVGSQKPTYHLEISKADAATPLGWAVQAVGAPEVGAADPL